MEPTRELIDSIYAEKVERARAMSPDSKLRAGTELFDFAVQWMKTGIRTTNPEYTEEQVRLELHRRFEIARRLENRS